MSASALWSLKPLRLELPAGQGASVDAFIRASWGKAGVTGSGLADRRTLIRRVSLGLTGLLPSAAEVAAFVADDSPEAYPRLVERLLASPQYGEQWARHWLDIARYSDTKGYVYAREEKRWVHAWSYRDWVVRALNDDLSYADFLRLQLAADQLVPAGSPHLAAMGFLTIGRRFLGVTHDIIDDRIDAVMRGMQGLTVACARCHDHKYDPISTRDYYALYGVFQSCSEALLPCSTAPASAELLKLQQTLRDTMAKRREEQMARTRAKVREHLLAQLELEKYPEEVFGQLLDAADMNPFIVRRWQSWLRRDAESPQPQLPQWHRLAAAKDVAGLRAQAEVEAQRFAQVETAWQRLRKQNPKASALTEASDEALRRVLYGAESPCFVPDETIASNEMYFPTGVVTELWKLQGEVDRWLLKTPSEPAHAMVLVDRERAAEPRVFLRGNPLTKGDAVPRQYLPAIAGASTRPFQKGSGRLELAEAIASERNPLTARVMVNRVWQHHFGSGLVKTASDFGARAEQPVHPELLDWLAAQFIKSGWSLKHLHRLILLSQTYQQASAGEAAERAKAADAENQLLTRAVAHRLSFEEARDAWLQAAGTLDLKLGGRPVPLFGSERRRTLYALIDRENVPAILRTFDFANPDLSIPQRAETTVPQQALFGLNHSFIAQQAKAIARAAAGPSDTATVRAVYQRLYQREPTADELANALAFAQMPEPTKQPVSPSAKAWSYGYGEWDKATGRLRSFTALPHFTGDAWQGDADWPSAKLGWAQLSASGGHPGNDLRHAVARRWTAPSAGVYRVESKLTHQPEVSDGIRAFISHSRHGQLKSTAIKGNSASLNVEAIECRAGDSIDFIVDINQELNSDQFLWAPIISSPAQRWDAQADFASTPREGLAPLEQLTQVLMLSNEFMFVD